MPADGPHDAAAATVEDADSPGLTERVKRHGGSVTSVSGYVASFGIALGAAAVLLEGLLAAVPGLPETVASRLFWDAALLVPAFTFGFLALLDDATLVRPAWPEGHPSLGDAWTAVVLTFGVVVTAVWTPALPGGLRTAGWAAAWTGAYVLLPLWLGRRCLAHSSWLLGGLTALVSPLVLTVAGLSFAWMAPPRSLGVGDAAGAVVIAAVGSALSYWLATRSPDSPGVGSRLGAGVRRVLVGLRDDA